MTRALLLVALCLQIGCGIPDSPESNNGTPDSQSNGAPSRECEGNSDCSDDLVCVLAPIDSTSCGTICDPAAQTGCGDGETCTVGDPGVGYELTSDTPYAVRCEAAGAAALGEDCSSTSCAVGLHCYRDPHDAAATSTCREYCPGRREFEAVCPDRQVCVQLLPSDGRFSVCLPAADECSPVERTCPNGTSCQATQQGMRCVDGGGGEIGDPCPEGFENQCSDGLTCIFGGPGDGICSPYCDDEHPCERGYCSSFGDYSVCVSLECPADEQWGEIDGMEGCFRRCMMSSDCTDGQTCSGGVCREG